MFRSGVGFLRLSHPGLVSVLLSAPSLLEMKFFQKLFPIVSVLFGGFLNQLLKYNSFHLQIRYHTSDDVLITTNEIASATHLRTRHHTADKRVHRLRRTHFLLVRRRTLLALEMSVFRAGDKQVENVCSNSSYTHTQLATSDFQKELLSR